MTLDNSKEFNRTNAILAGFVFVVSFIIYAMTLQRSFSFWDCGEFIACAAILGVPHPPGTPLFVLLGRLFAMIPFVEDISYRINYLSVIGSAFTAMFSYLLTVRLVGYFFGDDRDDKLNRFIAYTGGIAGGFFVAFSRTNWGNSVEAEVYGIGLALSVAIVWLTVRFFEQRGTKAAVKTMVLAIYLALVGVGIHMTVFLVVPTCAIFFILKKNALPRDWLAICGFIILELLLILMFADGRGGPQAFKLVSVILGLTLVAFLFKKIHWTILIAIASVSTVMIGFSLYRTITPVALAVLIVLAIASQKKGWNLNWKAGLAILLVAFMGISVHLFIPIRSTANPRIDENNPSRGWPSEWSTFSSFFGATLRMGIPFTDTPSEWRTFMNFLDRKQYGQTSMIDRMLLRRRGTLANQFGRHPHMGFWSYFEEQYSPAGWAFIIPFFCLGMLGMITAIKKRLEIGLPFFTLFLLCSAGLILYMNFADGVNYDIRTGDAYLEVRDRDYFFTPAFVFFGIAMGMGVSAVMQLLKNKFSAAGAGMQKKVAIASAVLVLLPLVALSRNYHPNDRSANNIPYHYAANLLDTCEPNSILFTSGDNDTFPLWCLQETYNFRRDVRIVNLSLLNTDWYIEQMKNRFDVPIALSNEQILWEPYEIRPGLMAARPAKRFHDRARRRQAYLYGGSGARVQDMMVDEIVIENNWKYPIYFSSPPYAASPLGLRNRVKTVGLLYKLVQDTTGGPVDLETGYDYFMNKYVYDGYQDASVFRNENATGVFIGVGIHAIQLYDGLMKAGETEKAEKLVYKIIEVYPEYWQSYMVLAEKFDKAGDSAAAEALLVQMHDTLTHFLETNPGNIFYMQDLGVVKFEIGKRRADEALKTEGANLLWKAFNTNSNSNYAFRKLISVLGQMGNYSEVQRAARQFANYKVNLRDPFVQQILGMGGAPPPIP